MHFDWTITFGNVITIGIATIAALAAWWDLRYRVVALEEWRLEHHNVTHDALRSISDTEKDLAVLKQIADGQERRLRLLEEFFMRAIPVGTK
jgi:hypothetical protein